MLEQGMEGGTHTVKKRFKHMGEVLRHIGLRSIAVALAVLVLSLGLAAYIGFRFYATEKEVLLQEGELNAKESALEYERFLLTRANIVRLAAYTVEDLLASGADNRVIEAYITEETTRIIAALDPGTTGLYGWINGEYLDGAGWTPDDGYIATERPWYTQTLCSDQEITFVEPYLDVHTNTVMLTVTQLLPDGKSVVAMDVSLDPIQRIVEQTSSAAEGSLAFVLDESGIVVVHSDETQLGRNYLEEPDSLGGSAAKILLCDSQTQFDIHTAEGNYSVYVDKLEGGWYSVSLINADIWYQPLQRTTFAFYLILALIEIFLLFVFLRLHAKNLALEKLHIQIRQETERGAELQLLSETDRMTGLFDRISGRRRVDELLAAGTAGMFLELDIDHFKSINDTCGHQVGDRVILAVVDAMRSTFRSNDVMMRLGGDEFGVFAVGITEQAVGEHIVRRLFSRLEALSIPELHGKKICVSVGALLCRGNGLPFDSLYARADTALYASKKAVGNRVTFTA